MPIWKLEPADLSSEHWACSTHKGTIIVRAPDEKAARSAATSAFGIAATVPRSRETLFSPWEQANLVKCLRLHNSSFDENGPTEVLDPPQYD